MAAALASQRALLDALMGANRNSASDESQPTRRIKWTDPEVCPYFLCGFCPNALFTNTKSDLGECTYVHHDESIRDEFLREPIHVQLSLERRFLTFLETILRDLERKIARGRSRLESVDPQEAALESERKKRIEQAQKVNETIQSLQLQVVELTAEGKPAEASSLLKLLETMEAEKVKLAPQLDEDTRASAAYIAANERKMVVCDVCGAYLVIGDITERINSHTEGKSHVGFSKIRSAIEELKKKLADAPRHRSRSPRRSSRSPRRDSRDRDRRSSRDYDRDRDRRDRDSRDRRDRDRSRDRDRDRRR